MPRNPQLIRGLPTFSRSAASKRSGAWAVKNKKAAAPAKKAEVKTVTKKFNEKKNESRNVVPKGQKWYPTEEVSSPLPNHKTNKPQKLRQSITPGTVLILLVGRFAGRRVVFLKQLTSGLLLVTGPHKVNGVPLRRVNQAYVIATSTKVDVSGVKTEKFDDAYFKKPVEKKQKTQEQFFAEDANKKRVFASGRLEDQKAVDSALLPVLKKNPTLVKYLGARFSLKKSQFPHALKF
jgi:large subunit ribosomal protein L6e